MPRSKIERDGSTKNLVAEDCCLKIDKLFESIENHTGQDALHFFSLIYLTRNVKQFEILLYDTYIVYIYIYINFHLCIFHNMKLNNTNGTNDLVEIKIITIVLSI